MNRKANFPEPLKFLAAVVGGLIVAVGGGAILAIILGLLGYVIGLSRITIGADPETCCVTGLMSGVITGAVLPSIVCAALLVYCIRRGEGPNSPNISVGDSHYWSHWPFVPNTELSGF